VHRLEKRRMKSRSDSPGFWVHAQVPGVSRAHVCALEVPHEGADQIIPVMNLAGREVLEPCPHRVSEVQG
jgi:hypothetical protein